MAQALGFLLRASHFSTETEGLCSSAAKGLVFDNYSSMMYYLSMNNYSPPKCDALHLIETLVRTGKILETRLDEALEPTGLTASQWGVLRALAEADAPLPLGEIAAKLACVKSNATQLADRLEAQHLVERVANPLDRRSTQAALTGAGRAKYEEGARIVTAFEARYLEPLDERERAALDAALARLAGQTEKG